MSHTSTRLILNTDVMLGRLVRAPSKAPRLKWLRKKWRFSSYSTGADVELLVLGPALDLDLATLSLLLARDGREAQVAEFHVGAHAQQALAPLDEVGAQRQADVADLDVLDDLVLAELRRRRTGP